MPTPFEDLAARIAVMMAAVATASGETITLAPDTYGDDFRIPDGESMYQVRMSPAEDWHRATLKYPRIEVEILIHHMIDIDADRIAFLHETMSYATDEFLDRGPWKAEPGIYALDPEDEPEIDGGDLAGKVISYTITATVLMDGA